jgi:hypothetical protein
VGASSGDTLKTNMSRAKTLAVSLPENQSRTNAIDVTAAAQLPRACTKRRAMRVSMRCTAKQPTEATT